MQLRNWRLFGCPETGAPQAWIRRVAANMTIKFLLVRTLGKLARGSVIDGQKIATGDTQKQELVKF
jgi:hypothetical protein